MPDCPACQALLLIFLLGKNGSENHLRDTTKMVCLVTINFAKPRRRPCCGCAERCWIKKRPLPPPPQDHRPSLSPPASSPLSPLPPIPPITLYPLLSPYPTLSSMCSCGGSGLLLYIIYIYILVLYSCLYYYISILVLYSNLYYTV